MFSHLRRNESSSQSAVPVMADPAAAPAWDEVQQALESLAAGEQPDVSLCRNQSLMPF
jgi:hypothetical protein